MTTKIILKLAAAAVAFAAPSLASATTMSIAYNAGASTVQNISATFSTGTVTASAGRLAFNTSGVNALDPVTATIYAFCIEPTQWVGTGSIQYNVDALKNGNTTLAPTNLGGASTSTALASQTKASLINQLFARLFTAQGTDYLQQGATMSVDMATAMQFAIWEIVGETASSYSITSGTAQMQVTTAGSYSSVAAHQTAVASLANGYLSALTVGGPQINGLFALDNNGQQDQVAQYTVTNAPSRLDVPEPATLGLFGFGALAMGLRRRKAK